MAILIMAVQATRWGEGTSNRAESFLRPSERRGNQRFWEYAMGPATSEYSLATTGLVECLPQSTQSRGTCDVTSEIERSLALLETSQVAIPAVPAVRDYLLKYPDLLELLRRVCRLTRSRFSPDTQLSLEVYRDPEFEDEYLTLYVRQRKYDDRLTRAIGEIRSMYEEDLAETRGWLQVTTDFQPPRQ